MSPERWRALLLLLVTLATLWHLVLGGVQAQGIGIAALSAYLLTLRQLSGMARALLGAAVLLTLFALWRHPQPGGLLFEAAGRFAFFTTFLVALSLLRLPAYNSPLVSRCGQCMLLQPPSRRYPILSLGTALFSIILNIGVLNLFASMIEQSNTLAAAQGRVWLQRVRRRRMMLALLRGFALALLISPMGLGVAVVLSSMPGLRWVELAPYALGAAALLFLAGWLIDYLSGPHPPAGSYHSVPSLWPLGQFVLLLLSLVALIFVLANGLELRLPTAVLLGAPLGAFFWMVWQHRHQGGLGVVAAGLGLYHRLPQLLASGHSEIVVMGAAGYLGHLCVGLVDTERLASALAFLAPLGVGNAVLAMLVVMLLAQVGINALVSVTLLAGLLPTLAIEGLTPAITAAALLVGWSLALISSPVTISLLILSRFTGVASMRIGYRWNGVFLCLAVPLLTAWFLVARFGN